MPMKVPERNRMTLRSNRNLRIGDRRYRVLAAAIVELEATQALPSDREMVIRLGALVDQVNRERTGWGRSSKMTAHRVAHLLSELECTSNRVRDGTSAMPVTVCHIPGHVRAFLRELRQSEQGWWNRRSHAAVVSSVTHPSLLETWEERLQDLRLRLRREPTQEEMLAEWNGLAGVDTLGTPLSSGTP